MLFIVRTDVTAEDGQQRVFGAFDFDKEDDARAFLSQLQDRMRGTFAIFTGTLLDQVSP